MTDSEALKRSEQRFRRLVEASSQIVWIANAKGGIIEDSPSWRAFTGRPYKQLVGWNWEATIHPDDRQQLAEAWRKSIETATPCHVEFRQMNASGQYRNMIGTAVPIMDEKGSVLEWIGMNQDVTERKNVEERLKHEKEFSDNILRTMPDGMDIVDDDLRIVYMNKTLKDAFGKDSIGKKCYEVYRADGKQCENCPLKSQLNGRTEVLEVSGIRNGKTFLISHTSILMNGKKHVLEIFTNITERKKMEENLLKLSRAVEQSHASIMITDTEGTIEYVNPYFTEVTGYSYEEAVGQNPRILKSGKQLLEMYKDMWDTIKAGKDWQGEFCNKKKNGELYWERVSVSPVKDASGNIVRFVAVKEDITERKQMEEALRESEQHLSRSQEIAQLGSWELDIVNNRLTWSDEVYRIFGMQPQEFEVTYKAFLKAVHPEDRQSVDESYSGSLREGRDTYEIEHRIVRKDGEVRIVHEKCEHIRDATGRIVRSVGMVHDITERKKLEDELKREKDVLDVITESTETNLAYMDTNFNFVKVNSAYAENYGYKPEEFAGKNYFDLFPGDENKTVFERVRDTGKAVEFYARPIVFRNQPERGMTYWDWTLVPIKDSSGRAEGFVLSLIDITHRKSIEEALKNAYERLKKVDHLKSSILRDVSHELKHPISLITMATNALADEINKESPSKKGMEKYIDIMQRNSKTFDQKVTSVLELSRLESTEMMSREDIDLADVINMAVRNNHETAKAKGLEIRSSVEAVTISANSDMISSLVQNLIGNAVRYTNKGRIEIVCRKDRGNAIISVRDTGIGISSENISRIFEPFFKADLSSEGIGVGLPICKKVVELHGGRIDVQSAPGKGSTFTATIPLA